MNIVEFVSKFSDLIPYQFELSIGGKRKDEIVIDENFISEKNFKGKMIPSRKVKGRLVPLQGVSLPINYRFEVDDSLKEYFVKYDKTGESGTASFNSIDMTNKNGTEHVIRILNEKGLQFGYIQLELNASGDITHKTCSYTNSDFSHEVTHSVDIKFCDGKFIREERTTYTEKDFKSDISTTAKIYQVDGITTGISIVKKKKEGAESKPFYYLARTESPSYQDVVSNPIQCEYENFVIREDLINFRKRKEFLDSLDPSKNLSLYASDSDIEYYQNEKNDLFYGFVGEYTGNTILITEDSTILMVRTSDGEFNYYTEIDLEGTDPFIGSDPCFDEERDSEYFERIRTSSKESKFKTQTIAGEEQLVPKDGEVCSTEEIESFNQFKNLYLEPFGELSKVKVGKLMQKKK